MTAVQVPDTRYARSGDVHIAYQVLGDGDLDIVFIPPWVSHLEMIWEEPSYARWCRRLASFARLIMFDRRGVGLSDRVPVTGQATLDGGIDDVAAVMDEVGSERAAIVGGDVDSGQVSAMFAATAPQRTAALVLYGSFPRGLRSDDYPWGPSEEDLERTIEAIEAGWGGPMLLAQVAPSRVADPQFADWWARYQRMAASPGTVAAIIRNLAQVDIRPVLPTIHVPTLVIHRTGDRMWPVEGARATAEAIPDARLAELPGDDHLPFVGDADAILDEIEEFLTGVRPGHAPDRVLATVLFTDIVSSTEQAASMGDRRWRDLLARHDDVVRRELRRWQGREVKTVGDGFLALFDGPGRAIACASAIVDAVRPLGLELRAGVHTGECELIGDDVGGMAVNIAARVAAAARADEVLVSGTVRDLVVGSDLRFDDRGMHGLKGVPGEWRLLAVTPGA